VDVWTGLGKGWPQSVSIIIALAPDFIDVDGKVVVKINAL